MKYLYNPPLAVKLLFKSSQWNSITNKILLTFDDGPVPGNTEMILKKLNDLNVKALFFCVGNNISKYPELVKNILDEGHSIANHTYNHSKITGIKRAEIIDQLERVNNLMYEKFNYKLRYFRPPYGRFNLWLPRILRHLGLTNIMWSFLTYDFKNDFQLVRNATDRYLEKNSIVVLHDNKKCNDIIIDSIQYIFDRAETKAFTFGEPAECLR